MHWKNQPWKSFLFYRWFLTITVSLSSFYLFQHLFFFMALILKIYWFISCLDWTFSFHCGQFYSKWYLLSPFVIFSPFFGFIFASSSQFNKNISLLSWAIHLSVSRSILSKTNPNWCSNIFLILIKLWGTFYIFTMIQIKTRLDGAMYYC